jgi:hypothetical protein
MSMKRTFKTVNSEQALDLTVRLGDCLPPEHLARFVVAGRPSLACASEGDVSPDEASLG